MMLNREHFIFTVHTSHSQTFGALANWLLAGMPGAECLIVKLIMAMLRLAFKMAADSLTASTGLDDLSD